MKINLSAEFEQALVNKLVRVEAKKWLAENKAAIRAYNQFVDEHGCFGDVHREF